MYSLFLSRADEALFSLGWQSSRDGVLIKILVPIRKEVRKGLRPKKSATLFLKCLLKLNNCVNGTGTNLSESVTHGRTYVRCRHNQTVIKLLNQPNESLTSLRLCSLNVGSL